MKLIILAYRRDILLFAPNRIGPELPTAMHYGYSKLFKNEFKREMNVQ
jgi:hypothetical protein